MLQLVMIKTILTATPLNVFQPVLEAN